MAGNIGNIVLLMIEESYDSLSNSEKQVADFVMEHPEETETLTMASLAKMAKVSEPTIARFCRKLDYSGYQEFKIALAKSSAYSAEDPIKVIHEEVKSTDTLKEVSEKIVNSHTLALQQTFACMDYEKLEAFVELLLTSERVDFYGLGGSGTVAIDVENKFIRTGINTHACIDAHIQLMWTALMNEKNLIIIFSNSGTTKHFLNLMNLARKNKVKIVLITSGRDTALTKLADITFYIRAKETSYKKEPSSARVAMLTIMDVVVTAVALRKQDMYIENIYKTREALAKEKK